MKGKISLKDLLSFAPDVIESLKEAVFFELALEVDNHGEGNHLKALPKIHDKWTDGLHMGDISKFPGLEKYLIGNQDDGLPQEGALRNAQFILRELVKMADTFDRDGDENAASDVDNAISVFAGKQKSPLKNLEEEDKRSLVVFVDGACKKTEKSIGELKELFRRMRYFDVFGSAKEMGLEKTVAEMEKLHSALVDATSEMYELTHGKKISKTELDKYLSEGQDQDCKDCGCADTPSAFFAAQEARDSCAEDALDDMGAEGVEEYEEERDLEEDDFNLEDFWSEQ